MNGTSLSVIIIITTINIIIIIIIIIIILIVIIFNIAITNCLLHSGGFRGVQLGATPPLHDENSAWRPILGKKGAPYPDPNALFFSCFVLNFESIKAQKFLRAFGALSFHYIFGAHSANRPPSTLGWIRPCYYSIKMANTQNHTE